MKKKIERLWFRLNVFIVLCMSSTLTFADNSSEKGGTKLVDVFTHIVDFLTSTLIRGVGITAIACVGYFYLFENKIDKNRAIVTCAAIGIILGASSLYDLVAAG
tara:strand:- start:2579 stop:2890 length:312 start_codon:yes stop_codon:yes gene_type:complete